MHRLAGYKLAAASSVFGFGLATALIGMYGWHTDTACVLAAVVIMGIACWLAACWSQQSAIDRVLKDELSGLDDRYDLGDPQPQGRCGAWGSVRYSRLRSFGNFSNETVGVTLPFWLPGDDARAGIEAMDLALTEAKGWVEDKLGERVRSAEAASEIDRLANQKAALTGELEMLNEQIQKVRGFAEKLGVKLPEDIPF